ncbi:MAG: Helix-turn-helix domain [Verrucomicrobiota bacterium]
MLLADWDIQQLLSARVGTPLTLNNPTDTNAMKDPALLPTTAHATRPSTRDDVATTGRPPSPRHKQRLAKPLTHELRVNPPVLQSERELAHTTGLSPRSIRNYVRDGLIPKITIGRRVIFRWPQVLAALAKLERSSAE